MRSVIAVGAVALLAGVAIGALTVDRPIAPVSITADSFPTELFGRAREDVVLRKGGSEAVLDRLDAHFDAQLKGYRFAYGGDGAQFSYGETASLTIVNGQLAPEVPISDDTEWSTPMIISLNTGNTKCVSVEDSYPESVFIDTETGTPVEAVTTYVRDPEKLAWTDCVLFDERRKLALRLVGRTRGDGIIGAARQFRDELERVHANLIA